MTVWPCNSGYHLICDENFVEISMFRPLLWAQRLFHLSIPYLHCFKWKRCLIGRLCQLENFWHLSRQSWWCFLDVLVNLIRWQSRHRQQKNLKKCWSKMDLPKMDHWSKHLPKMDHWSWGLVHHQDHLQVVAVFHRQILHVHAVLRSHLWSDPVLEMDHEIYVQIGVCNSMQQHCFRGHCKKIVRFNLIKNNLLFYFMIFYCSFWYFQMTSFEFFVIIFLIFLWNFIIIFYDFWNFNFILWYFVKF